MRLLLCTDLDRTLLPNGAAPESAGARPLLRHLAEHEGVTLVYVTGRDRGLVEEAVAEWDLPWPDVLVSDVGTAIAARADRGWRPWTDWDRVLDRSWRGRRAGDLQRTLAALPQLTLQAPERQGPFKLSYVFVPEVDAAALEERVRSRLGAAGLEANVICSVDETASIGLLDVLPPAAAKRTAVEHVMERLRFRPDETVFAGDSGNDMDVLVSDIPAVVVANATAAVKDEAVRRARAAGREASLHVARGGLLGLNGNYAAGILEGVVHFHPQWRDVLEREIP